MFLIIISKWAHADLGISKCTVMGYPNKLRLQALAFTTYLALLNSPGSLHQKIKIPNTFNCPLIEYAFYIAIFSISNITKLDKLLIRLTKIICHIPVSSPNMFCELPQYANTLVEQLSQTLSDRGPLGYIYKGMGKYIITHYGGAEYLLNLIHHACHHPPPYVHIVYPSKQI